MIMQLVAHACCTRRALEVAGGSDGRAWLGLGLGLGLGVRIRGLGLG